MSLLYFSVGLNGAPFHADYSIAKWTDTSTSALPSLKYMGFTAGICTVFGTLFSIQVENTTHFVVMLKKSELGAHNNFRDNALSQRNQFSAI